MLNKKLEEGKLEEFRKLLEENFENFNNLAKSFNEIGIPVQGFAVKSQEDIMKNYNAKFLQDFTRDVLPIKEELKIFKKGGSPDTEQIEGFLEELGNHIQDSEHKSESIEMIRDFLEKNPKTKIKLNGTGTLELQRLNKIIKDHNLKPKSLSS